MDFSSLNLPAPSAGFGGQQMTSAAPQPQIIPTSSTSASAGAVAMDTEDHQIQHQAGAAATFNQQITPATSYVPSSYQAQGHHPNNDNDYIIASESQDEEDMTRSPSRSQTDTSYSSDDSVLESFSLTTRDSIVGDFKMNDEAVNVILRIANTADHNRDFTAQDIDLSDFGICSSEVDPDFDAKDFIEKNKKQLHSLFSLHTQSSSGYSSARSCDSQMSAFSLQGQSDMSEQKKEWRAKLREAKKNKDLSEMLNLQQDVEFEVERMQRDRKRKRNIKKGFHQGI